MYYNMYVQFIGHNMQTITTTNARSNLFQLVKKIAKGHLTTKIASKDGNVILMSETDYESLLETAELLSDDKFLKTINKADTEIKNNELYKLEEVFND